MRYVVLATVLWIVARVILRRNDLGWPLATVVILLCFVSFACSIYWWVNYVIWEW